MAGIAVIGLQWGDEGKGKVSAYLCKGAEMVVRFNGGANAGHTVTTSAGVFKLHMLPAGVFEARSAALGPGVYIDLDVLTEEVESISKVLGDLNLYISPRAHVVLPIHRELDGMIDGMRGATAIGTTRRGIGPAAMDKYARLGIRIADILEGDLRGSLANLLKNKQVMAGIDEGPLLNYLRSKAALIEKYIDDVGLKVRQTLGSGGKVVFEGSQGTMLDIDHGTYPYVTASSTVAPSACSGSGVGVDAIDEVVGVVKAYTTRVGGGPLPTEVDPALAELIRERGSEYGATTGRPRRIGWIDLPLLRYAIRLNGVDRIALTKLDVLSGLDSIKICVGYELAGKRLEEPPATAVKLSRVRPIYKELEGWGSLLEIERIVKEGYGALPRRARDYVDLLEEELGVKISIISLGPRSEDTIKR